MVYRLVGRNSNSIANRKTPKGTLTHTHTHTYADAHSEWFRLRGSCAAGLQCSAIFTSRSGVGRNISSAERPKNTHTLTHRVKEVNAETEIGHIRVRANTRTHSSHIVHPDATAAVVRRRRRPGSVVAHPHGARAVAAHLTMMMARRC